MHATHPFQCLRMLSPRFQAPLYILFSNLEINSLEKAGVEGESSWAGIRKVGRCVALSGFLFSNYMAFSDTKSLKQPIHV